MRGSEALLEMISYRFLWATLCPRIWKVFAFTAVAIWGHTCRSYLLLLPVHPSTFQQCESAWGAVKWLPVSTSLLVLPFKIAFSPTNLPTYLPAYSQICQLSQPSQLLYSSIPQSDNCYLQWMQMHAQLTALIQSPQLLNRNSHAVISVTNVYKQHFSET